MTYSDFDLEQRSDYMDRDGGPTAIKMTLSVDAYLSFKQAARNLGLSHGVSLEMYLNIWFDISEEYGEDFEPYWKDLVSQLAGPHGYAILKMYRIKHGLERKMTDLAFMKFKILVTDHKCLEALELVSPEQHKVFTTYYADPVKGYKHVAADLGISIGTVKSRLHRARQKIIAMRAQQEVKNEQATSQGTASTANQDTAAFPFTEGGE